MRLRNSIVATLTLLQARLDQPAFGKRKHPAACNDEMIDNANVDQRERLLECLSQCLVRMAGLRDT